MDVWGERSPTTTNAVKNLQHKCKTGSAITDVHRLDKSVLCQALGSCLNAVLPIETMQG